MSQNSHDTKAIVVTFTFDVIYGSILFIVVFGVAFGLSEMLYACSNRCTSTSYIVTVASVIKFVMLLADVIAMVGYIYSQTLKLLKELKLVCKDL